MRLIDADALKFRDVKVTTNEIDIFGFGGYLVEEHKGILQEEIWNAPTIEAVPATLEGTLGYLYMIGWMQEHDKIMTENTKPVRHGKWIMLQQTSIPTMWNCKCSECGAYEIKTSNYQANYCPNCGAKMDYDEWLANNDR